MPSILSPSEPKSDNLRSLVHAFACATEFLRRPGRFSVYHYSRRRALERLDKGGGGRVLDLGCGDRRLSPAVITVDLKPGKYVRVVADASRLPFRNGTCRGVWMDALLEHVPNPAGILTEAARVLKPQGWLYCEVPFLQGEHAAPGDYRRWTRQGLAQFFAAWRVEWIEAVSGPFSALAYQLRVCLSLLTSFGSEKLYRYLFEAVWGYLVWPLKFLDFFFRRHPYSGAHAFGYGVMVSKPD